MKIVCISDTHRQENSLKLPKGDVLIHAGDTDIYENRHLQDLDEWFGEQNFDVCIYVAGNHDLFLESLPKEEIQARVKNFRYLEDDEIVINGIKIFGSPWTPIFMDWAFMLNEGRLLEKWRNIPIDTDILVTHGPCFGILDSTPDKINVGSPSLRNRVKEVQPEYHIFGHIHGCSGIYFDGYTQFINSSVLNEQYHLSYEPKIIEIEADDV